MTAASRVAVATRAARRLTLAVVVLALAACRASPAPEHPFSRPTELGAPSESLDPSERVTTQVPETSPVPPPLSPDRGSGPPGEGADPLILLVRVDDGSGDAGEEAPSFADIASVAIEKSRASARVTVEFIGTVPNRLSPGELMFLGVDLFSGGSSSPESNYQLFAEGSPDGWLAYLYGPGGPVSYPGRFFVGGTRLLFEVPRSSIGGLASGEVSSFSEWSREGLIFNRTSEDRAPDSGRASF